MMLLTNRTRDTSHFCEPSNAGMNLERPLARRRTLFDSTSETLPRSCISARRRRRLPCGEFVRETMGSAPISPRRSSPHARPRKLVQFLPVSPQSCYSGNGSNHRRPGGPRPDRERQPPSSSSVYLLPFTTHVAGDVGRFSCVVARRPGRRDARRSPQSTASPEFM